LSDGSTLDAWGIGRKLIQLTGGSYLNEISYSPLAELHPEEIDLDDYPWPDPFDPGFSQGLEEEARSLYEDTELALMGRFGGPIMEIGAYLRGFENWLMDLILYPDFSRDLLERIADIQITLDEAGIKTAGKYLSILKLSGEDLGTQTNTLFSYQVWEEIILPVLSRRWKSARAALDKYGASHVKMMLHSDGAFRPFIPDIINAGVDVLDPIQRVCPGMELDGLKRDFGDQLVFHGSVDTQYYLPRGSVEEVIQETKYCIDTLGKGGGLILGPSHFVQPDVPPENVVAMYTTARDYGRY
jgi:uroporphyrinogen decarboxylase